MGAIYDTCPVCGEPARAHRRTLLVSGKSLWWVRCQAEDCLCTAAHASKAVACEEWDEIARKCKDDVEIKDSEADQPAATSRRHWLVVVSGTGGVADSFLKIPAESEAEAVCLGTAWARENVIGWCCRVVAYDASYVDELTVLGKALPIQR